MRLRISSRIENEPLTSRLKRLHRPSIHRTAALEASPTLLVCGSFRCGGIGGGAVARSLRVPRCDGSTFHLRERDQFMVWRARPRRAGRRPVLIGIRLLLRATTLYLLDRTLGPSVFRHLCLIHCTPVMVRQDSPPCRRKFGQQFT